MDSEQAKEVLLKEAAERKQACQEALNEVLEEYGFRLTAGMVLTESGAKSLLDLVPVQK